MKRISLAALLISCVSLFSAPAHADVVCTATSTGVSFGVYDPLSSANNNSSGTVTVSCSRGAFEAGTVSFIVSLSAGASNSFNPRKMQRTDSSQYFLNYNLYTSAARNIIWSEQDQGVTQGGSISLPIFTFSGSKGFIVYGRLFAGQMQLAAGSYSDSIKVTVRY